MSDTAPVPDQGAYFTIGCTTVTGVTICLVIFRLSSAFTRNGIGLEDVVTGLSAVSFANAFALFLRIRLESQSPDPTDS